MSIDSSLFILTRYREFLLVGRSPYAAVEATMATAGHTILVSSSTLTLCFALLILFPLNLLQGSGIGCALAVACTLVTNLTLSPALLLTFDSFFARCTVPFSWRSTRAFWCCCGGGAGGRSSSATDEEAALLLNSTRSDVRGPTPASGLGKAQLAEAEHAAFVADPRVRRSFWYRLGRFTQDWRWCVVLGVLCLTSPLAWQAFSWRVTDQLVLDMPRGAATTEAYVRMCSTFGYGVVYPSQILAVAPANQSAFSSEFFDTVQSLVASLAALPRTALGDFSSIVVGNGENIPFWLVELCLDPTGPAYNSSDCAALRVAKQNFVSADGQALMVIFESAFDPVEVYGYTWYKQALQLMRNQPGGSFYLSGLPADAWSTIVVTLDFFPVTVGVTLSVVFVLVGVAFRSVLIPIRSVLTIVCSLLFSYGLAVLVYQHSAAAWTHIGGLQNFGAIVWLPPVLAVSICIGIALDYDVFLNSSIAHERHSGLSTRNATIKALYQTGPVISAAGVIMAISFSGLLLSNVAVLNQLAFFMVFATLFDTFVCRPLLAPALFAILGEAVWWPGAVPEVTLTAMP